MTSLWHLTAPPIPTDGFEAGTHRDIVVVGAGLSGLMTGLLLSRAGKTVTVVDAGSVGALATGNTTGKLSLLQGTVFSELREHAGDEVLCAYAEANREGQAWLLRTFDWTDIGAEIRPAFTYAVSEEELEALVREREAAEIAGIAVHQESADELPFATTGALRLDQQAQVHPMRVLAALTEEFRGRGGRVVENCRVRGVDVLPDAVQLMTDLGAVVGELCVLATGSPILDRGLFFARLEPSRSFAASYRIDAGAFPQGMYLSVGRSGRSLRTATDLNGEQILVVGGGNHVTGRMDDTRTALRELDHWTNAHFAGAKRRQWWAAQDYQMHSRIPYAGQLPGSGGRVFTATGYNKWGMTNAVAAGISLSAEILGGQLPWADRLREHHLSLPDAREAIGSGAAVAGRFASGWTAAELRQASAVNQLVEGEGTVVREGLSPVGVSRVNGRLCRVSGVCTHLGGVLAWNAAEMSWDCPLHGSRFSREGTRIEGPAVADLGGK